MKLRISNTLVLSIFTLSAACSGDDAEVPDPAVVTFELSKQNVAAGETVTVTWEVTNATNVLITQAGDELVNGAEPSGSVESNPIDETDTFQLTATNEDTGATATAQAQITGVSGLRIAVFEADPNPVDEGMLTTLSYVIGGQPPDEVTIVDGDDNEVFDGDQSEGSVEVTPLVTTTYTITARGPSGMDSMSLEVTVNDVVRLPEIISFTADRPAYPVGDRAGLRWETDNADRLEILQNGTVVAMVEDDEDRVAMGSSRPRVAMEGANDFTLRAFNEDGMSEETISVEGTPATTIEDFTVVLAGDDTSPLEYTQSTTVATVTWATTNAASVELQRCSLDCNELIEEWVPIRNFPTDMATGTFQLDLNDQLQLRLVAKPEDTSMNDVESMNRYTIRFGYAEGEPNQSVGTAIPVPGDRAPFRGTISDVDDEDWYAIMVPQGSSLFAQVGVDEMGNCAFDTVLSLVDSDGNTVLGSVDNTTTPPISPCSEINPLIDAYARDLDAGVYYLSVRANVTATLPGEYRILVSIVTPVPAINVGNVATIGDPTWSVTDHVQWTGPIGSDPVNDIPAYLSGLVSPLHDVAFQGEMDLDLVVSGGPQPHSGYDTELRNVAAIRGLASGNTFPAESAIAPSGLYVGFTLVPQTGTASTGASFDFADGPIIDASQYPIRFQMALSAGGMALNWDSDIMLNGPITGDGDSHRHVMDFIAFASDADPADLAGAFVWEFTLRDAMNNGYIVEVPFTLTPP